MCQHYLWLFISAEGRAGVFRAVKRTNPATREPARALITLTIVTSLPPDHMTIFISSYLLLSHSLFSNPSFLSFSLSPCLTNLFPLLLPLNYYDFYFLFSLASIIPSLFLCNLNPQLLKLIKVISVQ